MAVDLLIRGGKVVGEEAVEELWIAVDDGRVVALGRELAETAREEIDARELHIFSGVIDSHVHFNEPGRTEWEGVATGSAALVAGGGAVFCDMPLNASPPTLDGASFDAKVAAYAGKARADFGLWGGLTPLNLDRLEELAQRGVIGFKAFMSNSGIADFLHCDDLSLFKGMEIAAKLGLPVAVHAESDALTGALAAAAKREGRKTVADYLASRPVVAELEAIARALVFAEETGCALHVVHVSTGRGVELIRRARGRCDVTCETCPHYLLLGAADMERIGARAKCAPPLRGTRDFSELRAQAHHGGIDVIGSDHSPSPPAMKNADDFFDVWGGIAGVQATLRILLSLDFKLSLIARLTSANVARRFALPGKGGIRVGNDADLALVDLSARGELSAGELLDRHRLSPYVGMSLRGRIHRTMVRGRTVYEGGVLRGEAVGQLVRRTGS